jgi:uncharacterized protein (DUF1786 family)
MGNNNSTLSNRIPNSVFNRRQTEAELKLEPKVISVDPKDLLDTAPRFLDASKRQLEYVSRIQSIMQHNNVPPEESTAVGCLHAQLSQLIDTLQGTLPILRKNCEMAREICEKNKAPTVVVNTGPTHSVGVAVTGLQKKNIVSELSTFTESKKKLKRAVLKLFFPSGRKVPMS